MKTYCKVNFKQRNNNNNDNKGIKGLSQILRVYPNPRSGQRALALIGWFERAVILCGGQKPKSNSHIVQIQVAGLACWLP